jgi:Family of unknown function (DUF6264)
VENDLSQQPPPAAPTRARTADVVVSMILVCAHVGLAVLISSMAPFLAMITDSCGYQTCGDEHWVTRAIYTAWGGSAVAVLANVAITGLLLVKQRPAFYVPILGCVLQVGIGFLAFYLVTLAGPIK